MQENLKIVRRFYSCAARRDWEGLAELVDPDIEHHGTVGGLGEGHVAHGLAEIRRNWEQDDEVWDYQWMEPRKLFDVGDRVVVFQREYQRGKGSGVTLEVDTATIVDLRDGRVVRMQGYMDPAAALKAAGLSEQAAPTDS